LRPISRIILSLPCGEEKSNNRCVKYLKIGFAILAALSAPLTNAEDFRTIQGKEYKDATVTRVEPDGIVVRTKGGVSKLYFSELLKEVHERFTLLNASKAHAGAAAKLAAEEPAREAEESQARERAKASASERAQKQAQEHAEKESKATAVLRTTAEQFKEAQNHAAQVYKLSQKGTLSGQVFVATAGGENVKLGARRVSLFGRDAIAILAGGVKAFATAKSLQLRLDMAAVQEEREQAHTAEEEAKSIWNTPTQHEERARAAEGFAQAQEQQANVAEQQAKIAEQQAKDAEKSVLSSLERGFRTGDSVTALEASKQAAIQARETAENARRGAWQARQDANAARQDHNTATENRQQKASTARDAAREAIRSAWRGATALGGGAATSASPFKTLQSEESLQKEELYYYSDEFFFSQLTSPIQAAETDAEGNFTMQMPRTGTWVIAARAQRLVGKEKIESYYWLQPVSLEGQDQGAQNLSNTNLEGATGISSLIPIQD
jgi:hypothetical protein